MSFVPFDDRDGWIWQDGDFVPWRDAKTHVLTHALHYGTSVFEGERMYAGEIFKLTEHSQRLHRSAELLDFEIPYTVAEIDQACKDTCAKAGLDDCYIRPVAFRGPEQVSVSAFKTRTHVAIAAWEWPSYFDPETKAKGIRLEWAKWRRPDPLTAPSNSKAAGLYMICTMAKMAAERRGYSDAMMLDWRGYVPGGLDDMGNSAASRWANVPVVSGDATTAASVLGEATHTLTKAESAVLTYTAAVTDPGHQNGIPNLTRTDIGFSTGGSGLLASNSGETLGTPSTYTALSKSATTGITVGVTSDAGGGTHNTVQKTVLGTFFIKL